MHTITRRINRSVLMFSAIFSTAVGALAYSPSTASAQDEVRCFVCACQGGRCICQEVACA